MRRTDIDRHPAILRPVHSLPAGRPQHPAPHFEDETGLLGHLNEFRRRHGATPLIIPANQRLISDHLSVAETGLGLEVQVQQLIFNGHRQIRLQQTAFLHHQTQLGIKVADLVPAQALGPVKRQIRLVHQAIGFLTIQREHGHAS